MRVTDEQVAALRAQLAGEREEHVRLFGQLDKEADGDGYTNLVGAAFFEAVDRRFAGRATVADVVEFVGDVRATSPQVADDLDPSAAERLIKFSLGVEVPVDDLDARKKFQTQLIVLAALIADEQLDDAGLDAFLAEARASADEWLARPSK